jgi:hypothetical protein
MAHVSNAQSHSAALQHDIQWDVAVKAGESSCVAMGSIKARHHLNYSKRSERLKW